MCSWGASPGSQVIHTSRLTRLQPAIMLAVALVTSPIAVLASSVSSLDPVTGMLVALVPQDHGSQPAGIKFPRMSHLCYKETKISHCLVDKSHLIADKLGQLAGWHRIASSAPMVGSKTAQNSYANSDILQVDYSSSIRMAQCLSLAHNSYYTLSSMKASQLTCRNI